MNRESFSVLLPFQLKRFTRKEKKKASFRLMAAGKKEKIAKVILLKLERFGF